MRSYQRLVIGLLLPPLLFALVAPVVLTVIGVRRVGLFWTSVDELLGIALATYLFGGLPCLIYAGVMEYAVNSKLSNGVLVVALSGVFGAVVAGSLLLWLDHRAGPTLGDAAPLALVGAIVGVATGVILRRMYKAADNRIHTARP